MSFRERYAECRRYADTGIVTVHGRRFCRFETRFDRARDGFWFRMWLANGVYAIDAEGARVEVTTPHAPPEEVRDAILGRPRALIIAIGGFTGISAMSSFAIPHLLLPETMHHELARNRTLPDPIDESCYQLDAATGLVMRVVQPKLDNEIVYQPKLED